MKKIKILLTAILLVASTWVVKAQGFKSLMLPCTVLAPVCDTTPLNNCEYICNGGFETYSATINGVSQLPRANGWTSPTWGTPDLFCTSSTVAAVSIPCNNFGYQASRTGTNSNVYAGIFTSGDAGNPYAEYLQTQLKWFLNAGDLYEVSFWISRADFQPTDNDRLDVFVTPSVNCINGGTGNPPSFDYANTNTTNIAPTPVYNVPTASLNDATNWVEVKFIYCANGTETHLIIGNYTGTSTTTVSSPTVVGTCSLTTSSTDPNSPYYSYGPAYLYVDDVSMKRITSTVAFSPDNRCAGTPVNFTITPISCFTPPSNYYVWNYGDGSTPTTGNLTSTHSYTAPGVYTVTVGYNVPNAIGCTPTHTMLVTVRDCCYNTNANNITFQDVNLVPNGTGGATTWASLSSGNTYTGNIAVPAPTGGTSIITNTLTVIGGFSVNAVITLSNCNVAFNHTVAMQQFSTTTIDHSYLWACSSLWKGIESNSASITITNSWIEDAYIALTFGSANHPGVNIDNVLFNKNYVGVLGWFGSIMPNLFSVTGSIFSSRNFGAANYLTTTRYTSLFPNLAAKAAGKIKGSAVYGITNNTIRSHSGIFLWSLASATTSPDYLTIGAVPANTLTVNSDLTNFFDYMNNGIYNLVSKVSIINNQFGNMITATTGTAIGAVVHDDGGNTPSITRTEVGRSGSTNYKNVFGYPVYSSTILDGVVATDGGTLNVGYNDFKTISRYGVSVKNWYASGATATESVMVTSNSYTDAAYAFYGYDNNAIEATVSTNTVVHSQNTYTAYTNVYLDEINKPSTAVYHVYNNSFTGSLKGVYALNTRGTRVVNNVITIKKPGVGVFNWDICLDNSDYCVVAQNTVDCSPTNSSSWNTMGILSNASANNTYKCNTISKVGNCLKFQYTCPSSTIFKNSLNNTGGTDPCAVGIVLQSCSSIGHIGFPTGGGGYGHSDDVWGDFSTADTYCTVSSNSLSPADKIYYDGGATASLYQPQVNLNTNSPGTDDSQSYVPTTTTTANTDQCNEGARINVSGGGKGVSENTAETNNAGQLSSSSSETIVKNKSSNLSKGKKRILIDDANKSGQRSGNINEDRFYEVDSLLMVYAATKDMGALNSAKSINSAISADGQIQQNQKEFNAIHATYLEGDSLVTAGQIQDLKDLAYLCPETNGLAVYQARGLIRNWDDSTEYFNECEHVLPEIANPENTQRLLANAVNNASAKQVNVFPNPSNGKLTVENCPENSIFELYDIVGRKIQTNTLNGNATQVDLNPFNSGTYVYKIIQNGNVLKEDKLILNK